jgi:hypothetical protein
MAQRPEDPGTEAGGVDGGRAHRLVELREQSVADLGQWDGGFVVVTHQLVHHAPSTNLMWPDGRFAPSYGETATIGPREFSTPMAWIVGCLILWIFFVPLYLVARAQRD